MLSKNLPKNALSIFEFFVTESSLTFQYFSTKHMSFKKINTKKEEQVLTYSPEMETCQD
jgi:hypothetical protein